MINKRNLRTVFALLFILAVFMTACAQAEKGLLPKAEEIFSAMPSLSGAILREAAERSMLDDGTVRVLYKDVKDEEFDAWSVYVEKAGCTLIDYQAEGDLFYAELGKGSKQFSFSYNRREETITVDYPKGTEEEKPDIEELKRIYAAKQNRLQKFKSVGGTVTFGDYPQDSNPDLGKREIEWIVLDVQGENVLLLSRYCLDAGPYNTNRTDITWEECTLRGWLNTGFYKTAFKEEEQSAILKTPIENGADPRINEENVTGGNNTDDMVFLLSYDEANKYFISNDARRCEATDYAMSKGAATTNGTKAANWWLRSPGKKQNKAAFVSPSGECRGETKGSGIDNEVNYAYLGVRPAVWLNLEAL